MFRFEFRKEDRSCKNQTFTELKYNFSHQLYEEKFITAEGINYINKTGSTRKLFINSHEDMYECYNIRRLNVMLLAFLFLLMMQMQREAGAVQASATASSQEEEEKEEVHSSLTFDPPIFQNFYEGKTMQVLVTPDACFPDHTSVNLSIFLLDPRLATISSIRYLPPGTPRNDRYACAERGENTSCWRFLVTFSAVQLGLSPAIMTVTTYSQTLNREAVNLNVTAMQDQADKLPPDSSATTVNIFEKELQAIKSDKPKAKVSFKVTVEDKFDLVVAREPRSMDSLFLLFLLIFITTLNFGFGCSLNLDLVRTILRRPIAPAIGFACQFCIMPLVRITFTCHSL